MEELENEMYLGDGVWAKYDGYSVVLDLRYQDGDIRISLEPQVLSRLVKFVDGRRTLARLAREKARNE